MNRSELSAALSKLEKGEQTELCIKVGGESYRRLFAPPQRLILLGCGHVSLALAEMAVMLDFSVTVADDRPEFADPARFSMADRVVCADFETAIDELDIRESDYVCVLTRGHKWDALCVKKLLSGVVPHYLGVIGSRKKSSAIKDELISCGYPREVVEAIHAPIGFRIGGVTTAEIALSICAEMVEQRHKRPLVHPDGIMEQTNTDMDMLRMAASGSHAALLTVIMSGGSTPVKSGSMMTVLDDGSTFGTIGGGLAEAKAVSAGKTIIGSGSSRILCIDLDNDFAAGEGMVCGGKMKILIEDIEIDN